MQRMSKAEQNNVSCCCCYC